MPDYFFPHREALAAALRLVNDPVAWTTSVERIALTSAADDQSAWLLRSADPLATLVPAKVAEEPGAIEIEHHRWTIAGRSAAPRLMEAVPLAPVASPSMEVVYVVAESPRQFRELAQECLMLDNDRLRYLPLGGGRALLRIEQLSAFLLRRWQAAGNLACYTPSQADRRLLEPWGWRYPLPDKLALVETADDLLCLLSPEPPWTIVRGHAEDIYERITIDPGRIETMPVEVEEALPTIPVALRLERAERREPARLWWIDGSDEALLDRLVSEASEDELHGLQIARLTTGGFVIVARPGAQINPAPALLHAAGWAARLPDEHLYVPVGQRLSPLLSRRSLIEALGLRDDVLTIVTPRGDNRLLVQQVQRKLLRPLAELADYRIGQAKEPIAELLAEVSFDFDLTSDIPREDDEPAQEPDKLGLWQAFQKWLRG